MSEKVEVKKMWYESAWDWVRDTDKTSKVFSTMSSFLMAATIYAIAQGISTGFDWEQFKDVRNIIANIAVGFAGGIGIPAVQENAMVAGWIKFLKNALFKRYRDENIKISDEINDAEFKRYFVKKENEQNIKTLLEEKHIEIVTNTQDKIDQIEYDIFSTTSKRKLKKLNKELQVLQSTLEHHQNNPVSYNLINYERIEVADVFNITDNTTKVGKSSLVDNSTSIQRKGNFASRFYMPIISILIFQAAQGLKTVQVIGLLMSTLGFVFLLLYSWYAAYRRKISLSEQKAIPVEKNRNTLLKQAQQEYKEWCKVPEPLPFDELPKDYSEGEIE